MDQIYIPKNREGFVTGSHVIIKLLDAEIQGKNKEKPYFYNLKFIEPVKLEITNKIFSSIRKIMENYENIIITGSFLDKGFYFNDIDVIIISNEKINPKDIEKSIENKIKVQTHIILLDNKTLIKGLSMDPLYLLMLSKCIAQKRFVYKAEHKINYKLLDLHLLKSKTLIGNFDIFNGNEKYYLIRNMIAIFLYLQDRKINKEKIDTEIKKQFNLDAAEIKQNMLNKEDFLKKYKPLYNKTFSKIMQGVENGAKPE